MVVVQSANRRWLVYIRNRDANSHFSESIVPQVQHDYVESNDVGHDDVVSVLTASEVVSAVSKINCCLREFRVGVTSSVTCN